MLSLICIFSQYKIVNGNYRDSDSLRVINKLLLNVNSYNNFEVSRPCTFCWETSTVIFFFFFLFFLKRVLNSWFGSQPAAEPLFNAFTVINSSESFWSLAGMSVIWKRLSCPKISTFGDLFYFSPLHLSVFLWVSSPYSWSAPYV